VPRRSTLALGGILTNFAQWQYTVDVAATTAAHARATHGGSESCECNGCRNFRLVRSQVYPAEFIALLESMGIDPRKDGEVYHNGSIAPGLHDYGGWFHFIGELEVTGDFPVVPMGDNFSVWLQRRSAPGLSTLKEFPLVQVEFHATRVPWILNETAAP